MGLNAHRVFTGPSGADHFLAAITIEKSCEEALRAARDTCREAIKVGLHDLSSVIQKQALFDMLVASVAPNVLRPKFKMQGSFAYRTLNDPAQTPPQEIDLDDGVFVPVSFLRENGGVHPALISSGFFRAVETLLTPVCEENGWELETNKPSCVRVKLDDESHIDFALYAIPDDQFVQLVEDVALARGMTAQDKAVLDQEIELAEDVYRGLRADQIMLAHRDEGWKPSDPRKLEDWFRDAMRTHGEQLRRICRYLKGWRDFKWDLCRLSSIALMSCVVTVYDEGIGADAEDRDDAVLLAVAKRLPALFAGRIRNPVVDGQYLDEGWAAEDRKAFIAEASALSRFMADAIEGTDSPKQALICLMTAFGDRIPNDEDLIKALETEKPATPAVLKSGLLKEMGAEREPQQAVRRSSDHRRYG